MQPLSFFSPLFSAFPVDDCCEWGEESAGLGALLGEVCCVLCATNAAVNARHVAIVKKSLFISFLLERSRSGCSSVQKGQWLVPRLRCDTSPPGCFQSAIVATNDGQKDLQVLEKKFDPKKNELKSLSDEINRLKTQLETQGSKLNDDARANLARQIDSKQKSLGRAQEDPQNDFAEQQNEVIQKILQKLLPIVSKYARDNGISLVVDGSKPWREWPILWASPSIDITKVVVDIYNLQSGAPVSLGPRSDPSVPTSSTGKSTNPRS
jgi:outer membrane protein